MSNQPDDVKMRLRANALRYYYKNRKAISARRLAARLADPEKYREWSRQQYLKYGERIREYGAVRRAKNPEGAREYSATHSRKWRARNPDKRLHFDRKARGLPEPTRPCPANCENCGGPPGKRAMSLDHSHETGAFRGWLCSKCNTAIGSLGDTIAGLERAIRYLRGAETREK